MAHRIRRALWGVVAFLSVVIALFSFRYLAGIGPVPENIAANPFAHPWLPIHAGAAATALLVGAFQFLPRLRARRPALHRYAGRLYVAGCLIAGASGLLLALGATTGPISTAGFGTLALFWSYATWRGWQLAMQRRFAEHRAWMIRSWAMTLAAVTLRLYLPVPELLGIAFDDGYRAISFLCWVPNLIVAELYLARRLRWPGTAAVARPTGYA